MVVRGRAEPGVQGAGEGSKLLGCSSLVVYVLKSVCSLCGFLNPEKAILSTRLDPFFFCWLGNR